MVIISKGKTAKRALEIRRAESFKVLGVSLMVIMTRMK